MTPLREIRLWPVRRQAACRLLIALGMGASAAIAPGADLRREWDVPERPPAQERFYRQLMAMDKLPSAPEVAQKMLDLVNKDDTDFRKLGVLIEKDPSLAARLLRIANSALFASRSKVSSVDQAVMMLGAKRVRELVLGLSVWGALDPQSANGKRYRKELWTHAATVAAAARALAGKARVDASEAFSSGLLHDIGKLVLGLRLGDTYWQMLDEARDSGRSAADIEMEAFNCHHGLVGGWLLQLWRLPTGLVDAVALHHAPLDPAFGLDTAAIIAIADRLVRATTPDGETSAELVDELRGSAPGVVDVDQWRELYLEIVAEQAAVSGMLEA
jgi:putative nucleotidyltransferase with HDIG domain